MEQIIQYFQAQSWFSVVTAVIALASAVAAITPTPKEGTFWANAYKAIDWLALNFGLAKDKGK